MNQEQEKIYEMRCWDCGYEYKAKDSNRAIEFCPKCNRQTVGVK